MIMFIAKKLLTKMSNLKLAIIYKYIQNKVSDLECQNQLRKSLIFKELCVCMV